MEALALAILVVWLPLLREAEQKRPTLFTVARFAGVAYLIFQESTWGEALRVGFLAILALVLLAFWLEIRVSGFRPRFWRKAAE